MRRPASETQARDLNRAGEESTSASAGVDDDEVDQILADSFPASDPPPWTLGVGRSEPKPPRSTERLVAR